MFVQDTPSFREVVEEATVEVETPQETPKVEPSATEQPAEQTQEEVFAEKSELTGKTPEQLEEIYKNWQRSYTEKRQKETQRIKEMEAELARLKQVQPQAQQPTVEQRAQEAQQALDLGQMSVSQYTEYMKNLAAESAREAAREEYQTLIAEERENQLASKALEQFEAADSRLNQHSPEFNESFKNEVQRELAELLDAHLEKEGSYKGFDAASLTKQIIERRDKELDDIIKTRTQQSTQAAKMREAKTKKAEVRGSTSDGQSIGGNSIRNILSEAVDSVG